MIPRKVLFEAFNKGDLLTVLAELQLTKEELYDNFGNRKIEICEVFEAVLKKDNVTTLDYCRNLAELTGLSFGYIRKKYYTRKQAFVIASKRLGKDGKRHQQYTKRRAV